MPKNPRGFPERLRYLMNGKGWSSRDLHRESGGKVSHATVENWLKDDARAGDEQVEIVASLFGWTVPELLYGHPGADTMTRLAELESALGQVRRSVTEAIAATEHALGAAPLAEPTIGEEPDVEPRPGPKRRAASKATAPRKVAP